MSGAAMYPEEILGGWSCGNPFYYGYGFTVEVKDIE